MKKLLFTLMLVVGFTAVSFAQDNTTAVSQGNAALNASKVSGEYTFVLPASTTSEKVEQRASYYTKTMTVSFDEASKEATISMLDNTSGGRAVIARFLGGCGVQEVKVDNRTVGVHDLIGTYLK